jgi:hypothetical protein
LKKWDRGKKIGAVPPARTVAETALQKWGVEIMIAKIIILTSITRYTVAA